MSARQLILASASPRRQELLSQIGVSFTVAAQDIDESVNPGESAIDLVTRLAAEKAIAALNNLSNSDPVVLGSDTVVVLDDHVLGKPSSEDDACRMLALLSDKEHRVLTSVCVADNANKQTLVSDTCVRFREISPAEARAYWQTGEPLGKAGAYAIQGLGAVFVQSIKGSYSGVMGLPLFETAELLGKFGFTCLDSKQID